MKYVRYNSNNVRKVMKFLKLKKTFVVVLCTFGNFFLILRKYSYNFFCFFLFCFISTGVILLLNELSQFSIVFIFHTYFVVASFFEFFLDTYFNEGIFTDTFFGQPYSNSSTNQKRHQIGNEDSNENFFCQVTFLFAIWWCVFL